MTPFFMAWQMFLWIPCPNTKWDENKKGQMLLNVPLIGLIIGLLWYALFCIINTFASDFGPVFCALFAFFPWLVTGFMHLDGYMDCADAALYFGKQEKKLAILKDSHVGSFAVIAMALLAVLQYSACRQIPVSDNKSAIVFIAVPVIARTISILEILNCDPLPTSSYVGLKEAVKDLKGKCLVPILYLAFSITAVFLLCGWKLGVAIIIGMIVQLVCMTYLKKNLGGMSGDISGSGITVGELACLIAISFV